MGLDAAGSQIRDLEPRLRAALDARRRTTLRAPKAGRVVDLAVHTVGGVITPGERLLDIVPRESQLVVEAELSADDIARVALGQAATVRLSALPRTAPGLDGQVIHIAADRSIDAQGLRAFYRMQVSVAADDDVPTGPTLASGMAAVVTVATEPRTLLDYLLAPLRDEMSQALRER